MYVITIIRNQHSIYTRILAAFPTDCLLASSSLASKTGSYVVLKIFPGTQHVQADKGASAASPAVAGSNCLATCVYNSTMIKRHDTIIMTLEETIGT